MLRQRLALSSALPQGKGQGSTDLRFGNRRQVALGDIAELDRGEVG
jgi:hypothetical protein